MTGFNSLKPVSLVDYDDSESGSDSDSTTSNLDRLSRIRKVIHKNNGLDIGIQGNPLAKEDSGIEKKKFVNTTIPTFEKNKKPSIKVNLNEVTPPFEFGDRGQKWRQIKLKAFSEQLSSLSAIENIVFDKYPNFIKLDKKCKYTKEDVSSLLNQYATLWDVGYILIEHEYLTTPANDTCRVLEKANEFLKIRFK